jgi:hypothetical protein
VSRGCSRNIAAVTSAISFRPAPRATYWIVVCPRYASTTSGARLTISGAPSMILAPLFNTTTRSADLRDQVLVLITDDLVDLACSLNGVGPMCLDFLKLSSGALGVDFHLTVARWRRCTVA